MTSQIKSQLKQVKILHKRKLRTVTSSDRDLYDEARRKVKNEINLSKKHHEENVYNRLLNPKLATKLETSENLFTGKRVFIICKHT